MAALHVTEHTDPACPFAWNAEPVRRALQWRYGDGLSWSHRLVVLSGTRQDNEDKGLTPAMLAKGYKQLAAAHGMPTDSRERPAVPASRPACTAVVATRLHAPEAETAVLRALRVRNFAGELLDDDATLRGAAADAGLDPDALLGWLDEDAVQAAVAEDMDAARHPTAGAQALAHKLAKWEGGLRYTCPSLEIHREDDPDRVLAVPGFQPAAASEVVIANLAPELERREAPEDVAEVLRWAGEPLATAEVAAVCDIDRDDARERLSRVATERPVGQDGFWTLAG